MEVAERLKAIAEKLKEGGDVSPISVREFLSWFNAQRRGSFIVWLIREKIAEAGLTTEPNFESVYIDSEFEFKLAAAKSPTPEPVTAETEADSRCEDPQVADPTYRLSRLEAANRVPVSVSPSASISQAVTLLVTNDFSQLPVMTNERDVKGVVSWNSIGVRFGMGKTPAEVRDAMDDHQEISVDASLFHAIPMIVQHQYVLVRGRDKRVVGIVTASDLSLQFQQLSEPFLLIGEIENHIRGLIARFFSKKELEQATGGTDTGRPIESVNDLTMGEYLRLIEEPSRWDKLALAVDRLVFCEQLDRVRHIRNDVMHFDPDGIPPEDLDHLRRFANFLRRMVQVGVMKKE